MGLGDLKILDVHGSHPFRVAASATRGYAGEPMKVDQALTAGVSTANTLTICADAEPVIGTTVFVGISQKSMDVNSAGTVVAQDQLTVGVPIGNVSRIRGKALTAASLNTDAEVLGVLWDVVLFDLTSGVFTIDQTAAADTSGLTVRDGDPRRSTLDVVVDPRALRADIS